MVYDHESDSYISPRVAARRKRRRAAFWVFFTILVLAGVGAAAAVFGGGDDSTSDGNGVAIGVTTTLAPGVTTTLAPGVTTTLAPGATTTAPGATTTTVKGAKRGPTTTLPPLPPPKPFKITVGTGVNVRVGPGTTYKVVGTVETGIEVLVVCEVDGEAVDGPIGATTKWLRITYNDLTGYVTAQFVSTGAALNDPTAIGPCPNI